MTKIRHQSESLFIILHSRYTVNVLTGRGGKEHAPAIFITRHACRRIHGSHRHLHRGTKRPDDDRLCHLDDCCDGCWVRLKGTFTKTSMSKKVPFVQDERNLFQSSCVCTNVKTSSTNVWLPASTLVCSRNDIDSPVIVPTRPPTSSINN